MQHTGSNRREKSSCPSAEQGSAVSAARPSVIALVLASLLGVLALAVGLLLGSGRNAPRLAEGGRTDVLSPTGGPATSELTTAAGPTVRGVRRLDEIPAGPADTVEVAYFHRTHRCWSCLRAEELTRQVLETDYQTELASGRMVFFSEDVQKPVDVSRVERYQAFGSSLYLGVLKANRWYLLPVDDMWLVLGDEERFHALLTGLIDTALGDRPTSSAALAP